MLRWSHEYTRNSESIWTGWVSLLVVTHWWVCVAVLCDWSVYLLVCVQEVAELKEEELSSDSTATASDPSSILSESQYTHVHKLSNMTVYTGIADLFEVKMKLKHFNDWQNLGLALGLFYPTLKRIDEEQRGAVDKCTTDMLAAWLQQQDNITRKGVPSWLTLKTALVNIRENELADTITTWWWVWVFGDCVWRGVFISLNYSFTGTSVYSHAVTAEGHILRQLNCYMLLYWPLYVISDQSFTPGPVSQHNLNWVYNLFVKTLCVYWLNWLHSQIWHCNYAQLIIIKFWTPITVALFLANSTTHIQTANCSMGISCGN